MRAMLAAVLLASAAASLLPPIATAAAAGTTYQYTVLFSGEKAGTQTTTYGANGRVSVDFSYRQNGRGPDIHEEATLGKDGSTLSYHLTGKTTYGAPLDETFERSGDHAKWKSDADKGELDLSGPALYVAVGEASPEGLAQGAIALARAASRRMPGLPSGEIGAEKLLDTTFTAGRGDGAKDTGGGVRKIAATLYSVTGVDFNPAYVWITRDAKPRLFAFVLPGWTQVIETGWESVLPAVEKAQVEAQGKQLAALVTKLAHRVPDPIVIRNARVFDSEHLGLSVPSDVYIYKGRISAIYPAGTGATKPDEVGTTIDAGGRVLLPALMDLHDHETYWRGIQQIAAGVTTTRDMGSDNAVLADQIAQIEAGRAVGPRIIAAGFIEGTSEQHASGGFLAGSLDDVKHAIDWYAQRGYQQIKLYNSFHPDWVPETTKYAHQRGLRVSGHVPAFMRAEQVVEQGYDEIQHMNQVFLNFLSPPGFDSRTLTRFYLIAEKAADLDLDSRRVKKFVDLLKDHGTVIDSTLTTFSFMTYRQGEVNPPYAPVVDHLPVAVARAMRTNTLNVTDENAARYKASYDKMVEFAGRLHRAGVPLVAGTDDFAGFALQAELEYYVKAGIPAPEVLKIATWNGAKYTRTLDRLGSITPGKLADLILVDGDPTTTISDIRRVGLVMKEGVIYYPSEVYPEIGTKPFAPAVPFSAAK